MKVLASLTFNGIGEGIDFLLLLKNKLNMIGNTTAAALQDNIHDAPYISCMHLHMMYVCTYI